MEWNNIKNKMPDPNDRGVAWTEDGGWIPFGYYKVRTWKGKKYKFVNLLSKGFWRDDITHWAVVTEPKD